MPDPNNVIDADTRSIWFCVPKAANSAIKRVLLGMRGIEAPSDPYGLHNHPAFRWIKAEDALAGYRHYLRIAVVRNPWDRLYSCWRDKCSINGWWESIPVFGMRTGMSFREFVDVACEQYDSEQNIHYRPQTALICHREQVAANVVIRLEDLAQEWPQLQVRFTDHCGWYLPDLPHSNRSAGSKPPFDTDLFRRVAIRYAQDFLRFGYHNELRRFR